MISWSAYSPRRAKDPVAWLAAKCIVTPERLREELLALGIEPGTFPQDVAEAYLGPLGSTTASEPSVCQAQGPEVESAPADAAQAVARRPTKRFGRTAPT